MNINILAQSGDFYGKVEGIRVMHCKLNSDPEEEGWYEIWGIGKDLEILLGRYQDKKIADNVFTSIIMMDDNIKRFLINGEGKILGNSYFTMPTDEY